jgi:hypothetical protein
VEALCSLARPELFGVGLQEVVDAGLLRFEDAPVEERVHVMFKEVVQDEAAEELFAADVYGFCGGLVAELEFEVGCLQAGGVALGWFGGRHGLLLLVGVLMDGWGGSLSDGLWFAGLVLVEGCCCGM